jgi:hypothetical protein
MPELEIHRSARRRLLITVRWRSGQWAVEAPASRFELDGHQRKSAAVASARQLARDHHDRGGLAQVRVFGKNGRIQTEGTYGRDPRRRKG